MANEPLPNHFPLQAQKAYLEKFQFGVRLTEQGTLVSVGDGIVWCKGLPSVAIDEILEFAEGSQALVFHLTEEHVGAILLTQSDQLTSGTPVKGTGTRLSVSVGENLLGRVVDPLGSPLDGREEISFESLSEIDILSPRITERDFVNRPLYTGNKIIDNLVPIGKGQRQLIIGDNGLGKRALALDILINQKGKDIYCVYVMVGQKRSNVITGLQTLRDAGAMDHTVAVVAEASSLPGLQFLAPFAGCAIAEYWMRRGKDTLIIYDDLTTHADSYRELSLLLKRPPGREAYPADIFFLHSRLLERSTQLKARLGGGSMTALPIIETKEGEIATYIPTNLISITDGQIYFDANLFSAGFLPAIDITKSVSRIGGKAQDPPIKNEAGKMKLDYLQFLELEVFTRLGARLEASMEKKIQRGRVLREILKQERLTPVSIEFQRGWMIAFNEGWFDEVKPEDIGPLLDKLQEKIQKSKLKLTSSREEWEQAIREWFPSLAGKSGGE